MKTHWAFNLSLVKKLRTMRGLSPEAFGELIGASDQVVRNWERGSEPSVRFLTIMSNLFHMPPGSFWMLTASKPRLVHSRQRKNGQAKGKLSDGQTLTPRRTE